MPSRKLLIGGAAAAIAGVGAGLARSTSGRRRQQADEVHELREALRRELERLADADVKASRTRRESALPPG